MTHFLRLVAFAIALGAAGGCATKPDPEAERRRQEQLEAEHRVAFAEGRAHLEAGSYDAAVAALEKAHTLQPNDADTAEWLGTARAAKEKRDTVEYENAMTAGRDAVAAGKHRAAQTAFANALRWKPNDPDARAAHTAAEVPALVELGNGQLDARQYTDATRTFLTATRKVPGDTTIRTLLTKAQDARRAEVKADYDKAMTAGRTAMGEKNYDTASRSFASAEQLVPGDAAALAEKLSADFESHLRRGQDARTAHRPSEAISAFEAALRLKPNDEHAKMLLASARQAKVEADRARYAQVVTEAKTALVGKRYRDAVRIARQAEGIISDNFEASQVRRDAERVIAEYDQWISKAKSSIQKKKYDEAMTAADHAAHLMPGEVEPTVLRSEAARKKLDRK